MIANSPLTHTAFDLGSAGTEAALLDAQVLAEYAAQTPWGLSTAIDLGACDPRTIRDADHLTRFVVVLCDLIEMRRFGEPVLVRFGAEPRVCGYSLTQLIETSLISGHFAEESNSAYIDVFSCKPYSPYRTAEFCRQWFGAATVRVNLTYRGAVGTNQPD